MTPEQLLYTDVLYLGKLLEALMGPKKVGLVKCFNLTKP
jgi:hypothetical protein